MIIIHRISGSFQGDNIFGMSASLTYSPQFHASMTFRRKRLRRIHYFEYDIPSNTTLGRNVVEKLGKGKMKVTTETSLCACRIILVTFTDRCYFNFVALLLIENSKTASKLHYTKWGNFLLVNLLVVTFFKKFLPLRNYGMGFQFSGKTGNIACKAL